MLTLFEFNDIVDESQVVNHAKWNEYLDERENEYWTKNRFYKVDDLEIDLINNRDVLILKSKYPQEYFRVQALHVQFLSKYRDALRLRDEALGYARSKQNSSKSTPYTEEIVQMLGQYYSYVEIIQTIYDKYKTTLNNSSIKTIEAKFANTIENLRKTHSESFKSIRLAHKKSRLQELTDLYNDRKKRYSTTRSKDDYKLLLITLDHIRKEVDGDSLKLDISMDINITAQVDNHLRNQMLKQMSLLDIILARVAAKTNTDPRWMIAKLRGSVYSKYTGYGQFSEDNYTDEVPYPNSTVLSIEEYKEVPSSIETLEINRNENDPLRLALRKKLASGT